MTAHPAWTLAAAAEAIRAGEISAVDLIGHVLVRLHETEPDLHAYSFVAETSARTEAKRLDAELARGHDRGPLHGIPVAIKDVIAVAGLPLEAGSAALSGRVAECDAEVVSRLRRAGAIVVGKTVTHELAYGQNIPPTRNAYDASREPGGSSAGSAVATAAGSAIAALGTDGGGSTRVPAALNGIVGLKPTFGLIPTDGVLSVSPSLDHVGICTRTVADCMLMLGALGKMAGQAGAELAGSRIGVLNEHVAASDHDMRSSFGQAMERLEQLGAVLVDVAVPELELAVPIALAITLPEAAAAHRSLLRATPDLLEPGTRVLLATGAIFPAIDYVAALRARLAIQQALRRAFDAASLDALASPATPAAAGPALSSDPPMTRLAATLRFNMWANLTGVPAVTVPCGRTSDGLPLGLQLAGRPYDDARLLSLAAVFDRPLGN